MALKLFSRKKSKPRTPRKEWSEPTPSGAEDFQPSPKNSVSEDPLLCLAQQQRDCVLLRDPSRWASHAEGAKIVSEAKDRLEQMMALVPAGSVTMNQTLSDQPGAPEEEIAVTPFLLDVHTVTNERYQQFVDAAGYDELDCWPEEIWPHLIELKDQTGQPAPRFWRDGRYHAPLAQHPVVGISWYEAQAYALWIGQRLPTEAEWQMSASWHIRSSTDIMRRFPWGDAMDMTKCNVWSSHKKATVPVSEYEEGAAPNQVRQLVGNVWEWTDTEYNIADDEGRPIVGEMPMHVVRGGAFDTYFECQTTTSFRTGQLALARPHNTGFRCAIDLDQATWMNGE